MSDYTPSTGDIIEQAARVIDVEFDDYRPYYNADGLCVTSNAARALADAGLLRQDPPTRDEIDQVRAEERERIAQAIEAERPRRITARSGREDLLIRKDRAARIARGGENS